MIRSYVQRVGRLGLAVLAAGGAFGAGTIGASAAPPGPPTVTSVTPNNGSAAGGFTVDIRGTNFKPLQSVQFGSLTASVSSATPTLIKALAPDDSASCTTGSCVVDVTVTTNNGTSATSAADQFTYKAPGGPPPACDTPTGTVVSGGPVSGTNYSQPTGSGWTAEPGSANDVGSGGGQTYVVGTTSTDGGFNVWHFVNGGWSALPGGLVDIAVGPDGNPWGVNSSQEIWHWTGSSWTQLPGSAYDVAVGPGGHVFVVGTTATTGGCTIWEWNGSGWASFPGGAIKVAAGTNDNPWVINNNDSIWSWNGKWNQEPGSAQDIAATTGSVWVIGNLAIGDGFGIYYFTGTNWGQVDGDGVTIAVNSAKLPWVTNGSLQIWQRT